VRNFALFLAVLRKFGIENKIYNQQLIFSKKNEKFWLKIEIFDKNLAKN